MGKSVLEKWLKAPGKTSDNRGIGRGLARGAREGRNTVFILVLAGLLSACATSPYTYDPLGGSGLAQRATIQSAGGYEVHAAVPGADEAKAFLGVDVYE